MVSVLVSCPVLSVSRPLVELRSLLRDVGLFVKSTARCLKREGIRWSA